MTHEQTHENDLTQKEEARLHRAMRSRLQNSTLSNED